MGCLLFRNDRRLRDLLDPADAVAEADLPQLCPGAVFFDGAQEPVDERNAVGILRQADAVASFGPNGSPRISKTPGCSMFALARIVKSDT